MAAISAGTAIALSSLAAGLGIGAAKLQSNAAERGAQKMQRSLLANKPPEPKAMPTIDNEAIKKSRLSTLQSLQQRTGRASTLLTSQAGQNNTFG